MGLQGDPGISGYEVRERKKYKYHMIILAHYQSTVDQLIDQLKSSSGMVLKSLFFLYRGTKDLKVQ